MIKRIGQMPNLEMLLNLQVHILKRKQLRSVLSSCLPESSKLLLV